MLRMSIVVCLLTFIFLSLSASTSSCEPPVTSVNSSSTSSGSDYRTMAYQDAIDAGIPPDKFVKQIQVESGFNPSAVSSEGAIGIAQFMPTTSSGLGIDPWNPTQSLQGAARLMARFQAQYGDYQHSLAAYNCGSGCLASAMRDCSYYYWCLPRQTEHYIDMIMN
jgi:soluble lytic murein transglycosylase-like protein